MCTLQLTSVPMILCVLCLLNFAFGIEEKKISEQNYVLLRWNSIVKLIPRDFPPEWFPQHGRLNSNFNFSVKTSPQDLGEKHSPGPSRGKIPGNRFDAEMPPLNDVISKIEERGFSFHTPYLFYKDGIKSRSSDGDKISQKVQV